MMLLLFFIFIEFVCFEFHVGLVLFELFVCICAFLFFSEFSPRCTHSFEHVNFFFVDL
jgi:hypothetical protein